MKKIKKKQEKRKLKEERKSLISETIDGLSIMTNQLSGNRRENEEDDEEMDGLIRTTTSSGGRSNNTTTTRNTNNNLDCTCLVQKSRFVPRVRFVLT